MSSPFSKSFLNKRSSLFMSQSQENTFGPKGSNPNPEVYAGIQAADAKKGSAAPMLSPFNKKEPAMDPCSPEFDYEVATDAGMTAKQIKEARKNCKDNSETEEQSAKRDEATSRDAQGEIN
jgi:hypothetical protein